MTMQLFPISGKQLRLTPMQIMHIKHLDNHMLVWGKLDSAIIALSTCMGIEEYKKRPNPDTYRLLADAYQKQGNANLANQVMQRYQQLFGSAPTQ